jgi:hypothetical protein
VHSYRGMRCAVLSRLPHALHPVRTFFTVLFKGTPSACQTGPGPAASHAEDVEVIEGIASWCQTGSARSRAGWQGTRLFRGGSLRRPYGREPSARGAAADWLSPLPQAGSPVRNAPHNDRGRKAGRAVLLAPGMPSPRDITARPIGRSPG